MHDHKIPFQSDLVGAPCIKEFPLILECKLLYAIESGLHKQFIGEIVEVKVEESVLAENGLPDVGKVVPFFLQPGDPQYFGKAHLTDRVDS